VPHSVIPRNWTEQARSIINLLQSGSQLLEACGKSWGVYCTYGKYYGLIIVKAPVDETVLSALLSVGSKGNVRTLTQSIYGI
jgi:uncharacterized protein with GYD domain